jgi:hypothetical protein
VNERIKELWNKAGGDYWDSNQMGSYYHINNPEKFAELIVQECMNVVDTGENQVIARFQARKWLAEHFGMYN